MKLLKKATTMAGVVFLLAIALVSCKEKIDVYGPMEGMAEENIPNSYSCTVVDSANFTVAVYEYTFVSGGDSTDNSGTYTVATLTGDGKVTSEVKDFTYKRGPRSADNISYAVYLTYADGALDTVKWGAASITDKSYLYSGPKRAYNLATIAEALPNKDWTFEQVRLYVDDIFDTIPYQNFTAHIDTISQAEVDSINAFLASAEGVAAVAWFNDHLQDLGLSTSNKVTLDTVRILKDLGNDAIRVRYFGWENDTVVFVSKDTVGVQDSTFMSFRFDFVEGQPNTGASHYYNISYDRKFYTEGDATAMKEETKDVALSAWGVAFNGSLLNAKNFAIIAQGGSENITYLVSALDAKKGQLTLDKIKFTTPVAEE
ncbi:MAG: hypothetical protein IJ609_04435 [Paludibacteraceae bacterium]|nr:hypothetical protein [Paludibacteraceae bacterium]MBR1481153.1 hypothetical protein [Paludibacteraceae bacterium]